MVGTSFWSRVISGERRHEIAKTRFLRTSNLYIHFFNPFLAAMGFFGVGVYAPRGSDAAIELGIVDFFNIKAAKAFKKSIKITSKD